MHVNRYGRDSHKQTQSVNTQKIDCIRSKDPLTHFNIVRRFQIFGLQEEKEPRREKNYNYETKIVGRKGIMRIVNVRCSKINSSPASIFIHMSRCFCILRYAVQNGDTSASGRLDYTFVNGSRSAFESSSVNCQFQRLVTHHGKFWSTSR